MSSGLNSGFANRAYELIDSKANSNAFVQGFSGLFGFIGTIATDVAVIPVIYSKMWDDIRVLYRQPPVQAGAAVSVIGKIMPEVLSDIVFDKVLGNVPVIGLYFNAICGKQMAWRLGMLFTFLAARGQEIEDTKMAEAMALIRHMFPQKDMFTFTTPDRHNFISLIESMDGSSIDEFNAKVIQALGILSR
jgi:hypothetical protein